MGMAYTFLDNKHKWCISSNLVQLHFHQPQYICCSMRSQHKPTTSAQTFQHFAKRKLSERDFRSRDTHFADFRRPFQIDWTMAFGVSSAFSFHSILFHSNFIQYLTIRLYERLWPVVHCFTMQMLWKSNVIFSRNINAPKIWTYSFARNGFCAMIIINSRPIVVDLKKKKHNQNNYKHNFDCIPRHQLPWQIFTYSWKIKSFKFNCAFQFVTFTKLSHKLNLNFVTKNHHKLSRGEFSNDASCLPLNSCVVCCNIVFVFNAHIALSMAVSGVRNHFPHNLSKNLSFTFRKTALYWREVVRKQFCNSLLSLLVRASYGPDAMNGANVKW